MTVPRIRRLDASVVAQIAAGEVIERPASVVKELVENSVDAGATRIDIEIDVGGTERILVADNGCGIPAEDLPLAFASHATSKLRTADDLFAVNTMGFRGEALASVGGVARVLLQSRTPDAPEGAELRCDGGDLGPIRPWGGAVGTRIDVRHLFFNLPVRKKFLKSIPTELGHVAETVTRIALANPGLHLTLRHNEKTVFDIPATAAMPDRIGLFFGTEIRDALYPVDTGPGPIRLTGYVADPKCDRGTAKLQYLFLNGRWFRDRSLGHAFQEAYRNLLMTGRYPVGFLYLTVPPDQVDVNVHPTKAEVRFRENSLIYSLIRSGVKARLLKENLVPQLTPPTATPEVEEPWALRSPPTVTTGSLFATRVEVPSRESVDVPAILNRPREVPEALRDPAANPVWPREVPVYEQDAEETADSESVPEPVVSVKPIYITPPEMPTFELPSLPPGAALQVHDAYLVLETPDGMLVIDQHALHERILFEQLRRRVRDGQLEVQRLLIPEPIDLPVEQAAAVLEAKDALAELGLEVADFGGNTILLSSYPTLLSRRPPHVILQAAIDYLVSKDRPPTKEILLDHLLATMACKAAVKAGDRLTPEEIAHLLHLRTMAEDSHHCPHGRPTSLLFSRSELDRQFRRT